MGTYGWRIRNSSVNCKSSLLSLIRPCRNDASELVVVRRGYDGTKVVQVLLRIPKHIHLREKWADVCRINKGEATGRKNRLPRPARDSHQAVQRTHKQMQS